MKPGMINSSNSILSHSDQESLIEKLGIFRIQGRDRRGRKVLLIIAKLFPARLVAGEVLNKYLEEKVFTKLDPERSFSVVYVHTGAQRGENFPGISTLGPIYQAIPANVKNRLEAVYFLHPGLQAKLFLATFGRFIFSAGFYGKLRYVNRVEFLWDHVRRNEMELPEFVYDQDDEMEVCRPIMDYGLESDHPRLYCASYLDYYAVSSYPMRCIV